MTIKHHPTDMTLGAFASGTLDEARALVVATHVSLCGQCQDTITEFECVAGEMLQELPPTALRPDALSNALSRLQDKTDEPAALIPHAETDIRLPAPLDAYRRGPWRWLGRGIQFCAIDVPADRDTRVFMLKAAPGTRLPHHKHTGTEWTCVFQGSFQHEGGHFGAGDFDEADEDIEHRPVVGEGEVCICLVALQGQVQLQGWAGRLLQPLLRF
jgi:putative transcriptional regulator